MQSNTALFEQLPKETVISIDHTRSNIQEVSKEQVTAALHRLIQVKKSEFQIGRVIPRESNLWHSPEAAYTYMLDTYRSLIPMYQELMSVVENK